MSADTSARDTIELAAQLIGCRSVTPDDGGSLALIAARLASAGFVCERIDRGSVRNLWATHHSEGRESAGFRPAVRAASDGSSPEDPLPGPIVCVAGHVDVVPPGPVEQWTSDPFTAVERDGHLYGRGAADMKGSVAAMVTALERVVREQPHHAGTAALLLTSDEEGVAVEGTAAVVEVLRGRGVTIDTCVLGEPTSTTRFGDTIKNGRRGSLNGVLQVQGVQCHIAYPERGRNPINTALAALAELAATAWDQGNDDFPPTAFQIATIHAGAGANNVIPGALDLQFNFRFSPESTPDALQARVRDVLDRHQLTYTLAWTVSALPFRTPRGPLVAALSRAIEAEAGVRPALSTSGGTSDGRFLAGIAREVVEFGPLNETIHKVDERVRAVDLECLSRIFADTIRVSLAGHA